MTNQGFVTSAMEMTPDRLNALGVQFGLLANIPAAGFAGRIYILTDVGKEGEIHRDNGTTYDIILSADPAANVAGVRTLGSGATQGAAGTHTHPFAEDQALTAKREGAVTFGGAVWTWVANAGTLSASRTFNPTKTVRLCAGAFCLGHNSVGGSGYVFAILLDGVQVASVTTGIVTRILSGSRDVSSGARVAEAKYSNDTGNAQAEVLGVGGVTINV